MAAIALSALFSFAASAQDLGYLSPRGGSAFVETAGVAYTSVDFSHPAVTDGALNTATVRWEQAPAAGCTNAMKLKVIRPVMNPFGSFFVIAERGPFNMVNGFNTVSLTPPIDVMAGDYLAVVQLRGDPCGGMAVAKGELSSQMFQFYSSDLVSGSFSTGGLLRTGYEFGARASAAASVLTSIVPAVGSTRGGFGSNFKTSMQLTNTTPWPIKGNLVFHPAGRSALDSDPSLSYSLSNFQTLSYEDVVAQMGQSGLGSMDVMSTSSAAPVITVRVYNDGGAAGTSGFIEEVQGPEAALQFGEITFIATPADAVNFRLNHRQGRIRHRRADHEDVWAQSLRADRRAGVLQRLGAAARRNHSRHSQQRQRFRIRLDDRQSHQRQPHSVFSAAIGWCAWVLFSRAAHNHFMVPKKGPT